jgi:hypothetical protein
MKEWNSSYEDSEFRNPILKEGRNGSSGIMKAVLCRDRLTAWKGFSDLGCADLSEEE